MNWFFFFINAEAAKSSHKAKTLHKTQRPLKSFAKTISPKVNITAKAQRGPEPFLMAENPVTLKENYSSN